MTPDLLPAPERGIGRFRWAPVSRRLSWDSTAAAIFSRDPDMDPLEVWRARAHPVDQDRVLAAFSHATESEAVVRLVMDDGSLRHALLAVTHAAVDPTNGEQIVAGVIIDVTATWQSDVMLGSMLDSISDGFIVLDHEYRVTYLNKRAAAILGSSAASLQGSILWDVFPEADPVFKASYGKAMDERVSVVFETFYAAPLNMWLEVRAQPGSGGILIYFQDISERRAQQEERQRLLESEQRARAEANDALKVAEIARRELAHQAAHDPLTDLMNRGEFERVASQRLDRRGTAQPPATILFLDLDRFKLVNDSLGHAVGDALLVEMASRIVRVVGQDGISARLGGDELVVFVDSLPTEAVRELCERLLESFRQPVDIGGYTLTTTVSIGLATAESASDTTTLLRNADVALYRAKDAGRDRYAWFDSAAHRDLRERVALEGELRSALDGGSIRVHYQPIFSLADGRVCGVEALARWQLSSGVDVSPATFIPLAAEAGLIGRLGRHVAEVAVAQAKQWHRLPDFTVWINISGREFTTPHFADDLLRQLSGSGVPPHRLGVEVTETVLADEGVAVRALRALSAAGVDVAIDDFGTGFSSIARLSLLPVSVLKIDRSFVSDIETAQGHATLDAIVHLAQALGMRTVAEGIETPRQLQLVREAGVTAASGYLLGRPAPADALVERLPM